MRRGDEERVDVLLGEEFCAGAFAYVDFFCVRGDEHEDFGRDQGVVKNDVGGFEEAEGFAGEEFGVPGTGADEVDGGGAVVVAKHGANSRSPHYAARKSVGLLRSG